MLVRERLDVENLNIMEVDPQSDSDVSMISASSIHSDHSTDYNADSESDEESSDDETSSDNSSTEEEEEEKCNKRKSEEEEEELASSSESSDYWSNTRSIFRVSSVSLHQSNLIKS